MQLSFRSFLSVAVISFLFAGCIANSKLTSADLAQLDPDFAGYKGVLLIIRNYDNKHGYNTQDKTILKAFQKDYKGEFKMVSKRVLHEYPDLDKYRYLIWTAMDSHGTGLNLVQTSWIIMRDRKTGKDFTTKEYPAYVALEQFPRLIEQLRTSK